MAVCETILLTLVSLSSILASSPIVLLRPPCPKSVKGVPVLALVSDVPAHALARCRNGDSQLSTHNDVHFSLTGSFGPVRFAEDCLFHKNDTNSYFVDVEVTWGARSRRKVEHHEVHRVSCMYDETGIHLPSEGSAERRFVSPNLHKSVHKNPATAPLSITVQDDQGREIHSKIPAGSKIRLVASGDSSSNSGFRALSCEATNGVATQNILQAGCGDGVVLSTSEGFHTVGDRVVSPYFEAFRLAGAEIVSFHCRFTTCHSACDGNSCRTKAGRQRRSLLDIITASFVSVTSGPVFLNPLR